MFSITIYFANFYFAYSCFRLLPQTWLSFRQSEHKSKEFTRLSGNLWKRLHAYNWCLRPHPRMFNVSHPVNCNLKTLPLLSQSLKVNKTKGTLSKSLIGSWIESRWHWDCLPLQFHSLIGKWKAWFWHNKWSASFWNACSAEFLSWIVLCITDYKGQASRVTALS